MLSGSGRGTEMKVSQVIQVLILVMICWFGPGQALAGSEDWRIALCVTEDPSHAMSVSWRNPTLLNDPRVQFTTNTPEVDFNRQVREVPARIESVTLPGEITVYAYSASMAGLEPATSYAYRVGDSDEWSEWFVFSTAAQDESAFRFLYFGDPQNGFPSHVSRAIRSGYRMAPDAVFMSFGGDLVSVPAKDDQWEGLFRAGSWIFSQMPLAPAMGNHAYYIGGDWLKEHTPYWRPHFSLPENGIPSLPETNYYFKCQGVLMAVLNGSQDLGEQAKWLDDLLTREKSRWIIITLHQPLYPTGKGRDGSKRRTAFLATIDKHQVDLVLQGHDHTFGRTFPLKAGRRAAEGEKGTIYLNSVCGSKQYELAEGLDAIFAITDSRKQFFHVIDVSSEIMTLRSYLIDGTLKDVVQIKSFPRP